MVLCIGTLGVAGCGSGKAGKKKPASQTPKDVSSLPLPEHRKAVDPLPPRYEITHRVEIKTSLGSFIVGLYGKDAPQTVANFLHYVDSGFYPGKVFHRIIPGFMVQGGGFDQDLNKVPTDAPISLEIIPGLKHDAGTLSMARTSNPHSATAQFFICVGQAPQLNGGYAAFGKVEQGYSVVEKISGVATETADTPEGPMDDVPKIPVIIEDISRR
jgi:cyclophilin family peptidyl-prolyl cis-trans isomerase